MMSVAQFFLREILTPLLQAFHARSAPISIVRSSTKAEITIPKTYVDWRPQNAFKTIFEIGYLFRFSHRDFIETKRTDQILFSARFTCE